MVGVDFLMAARGPVRALCEASLFFTFLFGVREEPFRLLFVCFCLFFFVFFAFAFAHSRIVASSNTRRPLRRPLEMRTASRHLCPSTVIKDVSPSFSLRFFPFFLAFFLSFFTFFFFFFFLVVSSSFSWSSRVLFLNFLRFFFLRR